MQAVECRKRGGTRERETEEERKALVQQRIEKECEVRKGR